MDTRFQDGAAFLQSGSLGPLEEEGFQASNILSPWTKNLVWLTAAEML